MSGVCATLAPRISANVTPCVEPKHFSFFDGRRGVEKRGGPDMRLLREARSQAKSSSTKLCNVRKGTRFRANPPNGYNTVERLRGVSSKATFGEHAQGPFWPGSIIRVKPEARRTATLRAILPEIPILRHSSQPPWRRNAVPVPQQWRDDDRGDMYIVLVFTRCWRSHDYDPDPPSVAMFEIRAAIVYAIV
ncbi:hypothetical protein BDP81DRAFT_10541 [Colletotrichum phormii]|uniref:Uncharacterized protein n=1 Tax=Colletotrichum phormii TaxID=359342 RepID=A0AAJ0ELR3_9PEZI|nr:uncharacterized protein BDP81DRAFT_10541 [Colletotrichum phormii]KAK1655817.1 hypothetical protein BDP81DRAFT_10541 [Colletotrichum phormii]